MPTIFGRKPIIHFLLTRTSRNGLMTPNCKIACTWSLATHQDAKIYLAKLGIGVVIRHPLSRERHAWLQLMRGTIAVSEHEMAAGDGAAISDETELLIRTNSDAEFLLFDLA